MVYAAFDVVVQKGVLYYTPTAHTSGASFVASAWVAAPPATTDNVPEGRRNLYYRGDRAVSDVYTLLATTVFPSPRSSSARSASSTPAPTRRKRAPAMLSDCWGAVAFS